MSSKRVIPTGTEEEKRIEVAKTIRERLDTVVSAMNYARSLGMDVKFNVAPGPDGQFMSNVTVGITKEY